ncbi:sigma-70 family RNA polymerase sigma factor [Neorhodopirellula pilleata]|uniref:RNA polymerase sigma factor n=1 Tax=Neorhodopirellula pilleata TaxID=2714738 RepID=A0A5C5ZPQ0_9BACT|nr:sigma-70 family RNA polymerase sigma factor [Neorhodopirellula pilleata]TWT89200.1 RNA polymerase sigma factor YlaC [Neorhodopirellula pilleata]
MGKLAENRSKTAFHQHRCGVLNGDARLVARRKNSSHQKFEEIKKISPHTSQPANSSKIVGDSPPENDASAQPNSEEIAIRAETWVEQFGDSMFRFAIAKVSDAALAEDLVQDTFIAAIIGKKQFRNESTVSTWLFAILRRKIAEHYRRSQRSDAFIQSQAETIRDSETQPTSRQAWHDDPAVICENAEFRNIFDICVEKLPNKLAEVFILREINQQSPQDICELLRISPTNLSMRLQRCRLAIRDCLNSQWFRGNQ